jgi:molecular chaperone GrpE
MDLVESIDNLERALVSVPPEVLSPDFSSTAERTGSNTSSEDSNAAAAGEREPELDVPNKDLLNLHAGLKMTESILMSTLKKHGLERFDPQDEGRKFDPRLDEATFMTKVEGREDGDVFHTQSKGFILNGRVIRPAKVGVVKNS